MKEKNINISLFLVVSFMLLFTAGAIAQSDAGYCEPSAEIKEALRKLPKMNEDEMNYNQYRQRRLSALAELTKKYPDDFHIQKQYAQARRDAEDVNRDALTSELRSLAEKKPNDPTAVYLYAQALVGWDTKAALEKLNQLAASSPAFPWTYLKLGEIYSYPAFRDQKKSIENYKLWLAKCPEAKDGAADISRTGDPDLMREALRRIRARLSDAMEPEDLRFYETAWTIEFKLKPVAEHPQVRKQLVEELKALRAKNLGSREWLSALQDGYKMVGDKEGLQWTEQEILRLFPRSSTARYMVRRKWDEAHPYAQVNESEEKKIAYYKALLSASAEWIKTWPDDPGLLSSYFNALGELPESTDVQIEQVGEAWLSAMKKHEGTMFFIPPVELLIAQKYAKRNIATERIPGMVLKGLTDIEKHEARDVSDLYRRESGISGNLKNIRNLAWPLLAETYAKLRQPGKAREMLAEIAEAVKKDKPDDKAGASARSRYQGQIGLYWETVAKVAEIENRKLDRLMALQTALSFRPKIYAPGPGKKDELADQAAALWKELGGTDEGWQAYLARNEATKPSLEIAEATGWSEKTQALPEFSLTDLSGKKWQLADLKGKTAFINVWATWCGPCVQELPYLQKLHEQMKDRKDVLILTLNSDDEIGLVDPFMQDKKYSFTVIPAQAYLQEMNVYSIPRNWVINREGVMQFETVGFGGDGNEWLKKATEIIQKVSGGPERK